MIELSIIIVNWNTKNLVLDCIHSILNSNLIISYEIIIVDNGSTDGSVESIKGIKSKTKLSLVVNKVNVGFAKANNQGLGIAKGKYVLLLNSDTKVTNHSINELFIFAQATPDAGVVGPKLLNKDGSIQPSCFHFPSIKNAFLEYFVGRRDSYGKYTPSEEGPVVVDSVVGAAFLITPEALKKVGKLNEKFFFFYEDLDYCRRVWNSSLKVYYYPKSSVYHLHGATLNKVTDSKSAWRRLIPGSKLYNGILKHYILYLIIWAGQKWQALLKN